MLKYIADLPNRIKIIWVFIIPLFYFNAEAQVFFHESFEEGPKDWTLIDADGDGRSWGLMDLGTSDKFSMASASIDFETETALAPDNWLISPLIDLTNEEAKDLMLLFYVQAWDAEYPKEKYRVYVSEYASESAPVSVGDFTQTLRLETLTSASAGSFSVRSIKFSAFAGKKVRIAFRHYDSTDQSMVVLDDITIKNATKGSDLMVEQILSPYSYNALGTELSVITRITNIGLEASQEASVSYTATGRQTVKENLPNIASGGSIIYEFTKKLDAYERIPDNAKIEVFVSALNDENTANNVLSRTFNVIPQQFMKTWFFENEEEKNSFRNDFGNVVQDEFKVAVNMLPFFPGNEAWTLLVVDDTGDFPVEYWGKSFLAGTSSFSFSGRADRWLILPKTYLDGDQIMFSWTGATYALGLLSSNEEYEVLVSEKGTNPEDFVRIGESIKEYGNIVSPYERIINLSQYAGKEVYVAFRNITMPMLPGSHSMTLLDNFVFYTYKSQGTGIENTDLNEENELTVFPNPVKDLLHLNSTTPLQRITLFNQLGQAVYSYSGDVLAGLNISHLPSELYVLQAETIDGRIITRKVLKK